MASTGQLEREKINGVETQDKQTEKPVDLERAMKTTEAANWISTSEIIPQVEGQQFKTPREVESFFPRLGITSGREASLAAQVASFHGNLPVTPLPPRAAYEHPPVPAPAPETPPSIHQQNQETSEDRPRYEGPITWTEEDTNAPANTISEQNQPTRNLRESARAAFDNTIAMGTQKVQSALRGSERNHPNPLVEELGAQGRAIEPLEPNPDAQAAVINGTAAGFNEIGNTKDTTVDVTLTTGNINTAQPTESTPAQHVKPADLTLPDISASTPEAVQTEAKRGIDNDHLWSTHSSAPSFEYQPPQDAATRPPIRTAEDLSPEEIKAGNNQSTTTAMGRMVETDLESALRLASQSGADGRRYQQGLIDHVAAHPNGPLELRLTTEHPDWYQQILKARREQAKRQADAKNQTPVSIPDVEVPLTYPMSLPEPVTTTLPDKQQIAHPPLPAAPPIPVEQSRTGTFSRDINATIQHRPADISLDARGTLRRNILATVPEQAVQDVKTVGPEAIDEIIQMAHENVNEELRNAVLADPDLGPRLQALETPTNTQPPQPESQNNNPKKPPDTSPGTPPTPDVKKPDNSVDKSKVKQTFTTTSGETFSLSIEDAMRLGVELPSNQASREDIDKLYRSFKDRLNELERIRPEVPPGPPVPSTHRRRFGLSGFRQKAAGALRATREYFTRPDDLSGVSVDAATGQVRTLLEQRATTQGVDLAHSAPATPEPGDGKPKKTPDAQPPTPDAADQQKQAEPAEPKVVKIEFANGHTMEINQDLWDRMGLTNDDIPHHPGAAASSEQLAVYNAQMAMFEKMLPHMIKAQEERDAMKKQKTKQTTGTTNPDNEPPFMRATRLDTPGRKTLRDRREEAALSFQARGLQIANRLGREPDAGRIVAQIEKEEELLSRVSTRAELANTAASQAREKRTALSNNVLALRKSAEEHRERAGEARLEMRRVLSGLRNVRETLRKRGLEATPANVRQVTEELQTSLENARQTIIDEQMEVKREDQRIKAMAKRLEAARRTEKKAREAANRADDELNRVELGFGIEPTQSRQANTENQQNNQNATQTNTEQDKAAEKKRREENKKKKTEGMTALEAALRTTIGTDLNNARPEEIVDGLNRFLNTLDTTNAETAKKVREKLKKRLKRKTKSGEPKQVSKNLLLDILLGLAAEGISLGIGGFEGFTAATKKRR